MKTQFTRELAEQSPKTWKKFQKFIQDSQDADSLNFILMGFEHQLGWFLKFLDERKTIPVVDTTNNNTAWGYCVYIKEDNSMGMAYSTELTTRNEAYRKAIAKAFHFLEDE